MTTMTNSSCQTVLQNAVKEEMEMDEYEDYAVKQKRNPEIYQTEVKEEYTSAKRDTFKYGFADCEDERKWNLCRKCGHLYAVEDSYHEHLETGCPNLNSYNSSFNTSDDAVDYSVYLTKEETHILVEPDVMASDSSHIFNIDSSSADTNIEKLTYDCKDCKKSFDDVFGLQSHILSHRHEPGFTTDTLIDNKSLEVFKNSEILHNNYRDETDETQIRDNSDLKNDFQNQMDVVDATNNSTETDQKCALINSKLNGTRGEFYFCYYCNKSYIHQNTLKRHQVKHMEDELIGRMNRNREKKYICTICTKSFIKEHNLKKHLEVHCSVKPIVKENLNKSKKDKECVSKKSRYTCKYCKTIFYNIDNLEDHLIIHQTERKDIARNQEETSEKQELFCTYCHKCFLSEDNLLTHIKFHETHTIDYMFRHNVSNEDADVSFINYSCNYCKKCFIDKLDLIKHIKAHMAEKSSPTSASHDAVIVVDDLNDSENDDQVHLLGVHQVQDDVNKQFDLKAAGPNRVIDVDCLNDVHASTLEKGWKSQKLYCHYCTMSFDFIENLKEHIQIHEKLKSNFILTYSNSINGVNNLQKQKENDINVVYSCSHCNTSFTCISDLENHLSLHTSKVTVVTEREEYNSYKITNPTNQKFCCSFCKRSFIYKENLIEHIKSHLVNNSQLVASLLQKRTIF